MNVAVNPHWRELKAELIAKLGYAGAARLMRWNAQCARTLGPEGTPEHFEFAAAQFELEERRAASQVAA